MYKKIISILSCLAIQSSLLMPVQAQTSNQNYISWNDYVVTKLSCGRGGPNDGGGAYILCLSTFTSPSAKIYYNGYSRCTYNTNGECVSVTNFISYSEDPYEIIQRANEYMVPYYQNQGYTISGGYYEQVSNGLVYNYNASNVNGYPVYGLGVVALYVDNLIICQNYLEGYGCPIQQ